MQKFQAFTKVDVRAGQTECQPTPGCMLIDTDRHGPRSHARCESLNLAATRTRVHFLRKSLYVALTITGFYYIYSSRRPRSLSREDAIFEEASTAIRKEIPQYHPEWKVCQADSQLLPSTSTSYFLIKIPSKLFSLFPKILIPSPLCSNILKYWLPIRDYSKRVYQGVRVKHTVKDLLAEKRSRQTSNSRFNGSVSSSQSPFVQMPGSPVTSGYYGVRRSFLSDSDFHGTKQFASDMGSSSVKPFPCESSAGPSHPALLDPYFSEPYNDHRPATLTPTPSSLFSASPLPPLLPPFPSDSAHFVMRDSWEQTVPDGLSQPDPVSADSLQTLSPSTSCLSQVESGSTGQHRSSSWGPPLAGAPSYSVHTLEELYHTPGYPAPAPYPFTPFMAMSNELPSKVLPLAPDEATDASALPEPSPWSREDGSMSWGTFECRRAY
ncbi:POU domain class 2-associating factor 2 [Erinaceus europaeus]|uniref:POU domain class 2-associating factor 2 n=1 Tax=Erinaceus europaeus TaxID=9365 RepID=A0ABM3WGQ5_ERIEU|nr:POU domain class 2-associating factor 2 [Erinaceus europaeus]